MARSVLKKYVNGELIEAASPLVLLLFHCLVFTKIVIVSFTFFLNISGGEKRTTTQKVSFVAIVCLFAAAAADLKVRDDDDAAAERKRKVLRKILTSGFVCNSSIDGADVSANDDDDDDADTEDSHVFKVAAAKQCFFVTTGAKTKQNKTEKPQKVSG